MQFQSDRFIGLCFMIFSCAFLFLSKSLPYGAALFPRMLLCLLLLGGGFLLIKPLEKNDLKILLPIRIKEGLFIVIATVLYFIIINIVGFYISTILYLLAISFIWGYKNIKVIFVSIIFYNLLIYILFDKVLHILIPKGIIF